MNSLRLVGANFLVWSSRQAIALCRLDGQKVVSLAGQTVRNYSLSAAVGIAGLVLVATAIKMQTSAQPINPTDGARAQKHTYQQNLKTARIFAILGVAVVAIAAVIADRRYLGIS